MTSSLEIADILRDYGDAYRQKYGPLPMQFERIMRDVINCRTEALGGHLYACDGCGVLTERYNSCRDRYCPKCQALDTAKWLERVLRMGTTPIDPVEHRDQAMLELIYWCGLRPGEVGRLQLRDVAPDEETGGLYLTVRRAKRARRDRELPLSRQARASIEGYLARARPRLPEGEALFPACCRTAARYVAEERRYEARSAPVDAGVGLSTVEEVFRRAWARSKALGVRRMGRRVTVYWLRHSIATHLLRRGWDLHQVRLYLGHRNVASTEKYVHGTARELGRMMTSHNPHDAPRGRGVIDRVRRARDAVADERRRVLG